MANTMSSSSTNIALDDLETLVQQLSEDIENVIDPDKLPPHAQESLYSIAYHCYQNHKIKDALVIFRFLTLLEPLEKKYWMGLAASRQVNKEYQSALSAYIFTALLDDKDPLPVFYAAECHKVLGQDDNALEALEESEKCARKNKEHYAILLSRMSLLKKVWKPSDKEK
ncbi:MAG: SycD/LcrH family type III secretion system chaperone [Chlamydiota bacterium]